MTTAIEVTDEEIAALTQSILTRYGIDFTCYEPKSLRRRINRILSLFDLKSIHELWKKFLFDGDFIKVFMNEISVGMTSMFRDPVLWKALKRKLNTEFHSRDSLSIWHSGCSTGEEVFSMGILLRETNLAHKATAYCTDINEAALQEARNGMYHKIKMIENEASYVEYNSKSDFQKYYTPDNKHAQMDLSLIKHANFQYQNLITDTYPKGFDIIFCRNVMIYFDTPAKLKLLDKFYQSLRPGGYFIIGFFDTMGHLMDDSKFKLVDETAKIFQKCEP
ncbi:MAG: protein-glutamate O-methyltransferase CheR [Cyclobacteriaceae bacterium]